MHLLPPVRKELPDRCDRGQQREEGMANRQPEVLHLSPVCGGLPQEMPGDAQRLLPLGNREAGRAIPHCPAAEAFPGESVGGLRKDSSSARSLKPIWEYDYRIRAVLRGIANLGENIEPLLIRKAGPEESDLNLMQLFVGSKR